MPVYVGGKWHNDLSFNFSNEYCCPFETTVSAVPVNGNVCMCTSVHMHTREGCTQHTAHGWGGPPRWARRQHAGPRVLWSSWKWCGMLEWKHCTFTRQPGNYDDSNSVLCSLSLYYTSERLPNTTRTTDGRLPDIARKHGTKETVRMWQTELCAVRAHWEAPKNGRHSPERAQKIRLLTAAKRPCTQATVCRKKF